MAGTTQSTPPNLEISDSARHWLEFADQLGKAGLHIHQIADGVRSKQQQGEVNQALMLALSTAMQFYSRFDPDYPDWMPLLNSSMRGTNSNNDNVYLFTIIRGSGSYRITGTRGSVKYILLELSSGLPGSTTIQSKNIGMYDLDNFKINKDGTFEFILSAKKPDGHAGNWIALDPAADDIFVLLRQISYDWRREEDGTFQIQRIDIPINKPRREAIDTDRRLSQIPGYVEGVLSTFLHIMDEQEFMKGLANTIKDATDTFGNVSENNVKDQIYQMGEINLKPDEALVIETQVPADCAYWGIHLMDSAANSLDYMFQQSGLNGHSARVDPDGKVRIVISQKDPGVANWLDKGDYEINGVRGRFWKCENPEWITKVVPISDVRSALYPGTPVVSYQERQNQLRQRIEDVQKRRRW